MKNLLFFFCLTPLQVLAKQFSLGKFLAGAFIGCTALGAWTAQAAPLQAIKSEKITASQIQQALKASTALRWAGGLALSSENPDFGGFSGLLCSDQDHGEKLIAVTDQGNITSFSAIYDAMGHLAAVQTLESLTKGHGQNGFQRLKTETGQKLSLEKTEKDSESLTRTADGTLFVSFERNHRVLFYPQGRVDQAAQRLPLPKSLQNAPDNGGLEAIETLRNGELLILTEALRGKGQNQFQGWVGSLEGQNWRSVVFQSAENFQPTGLTRLSDGRLVSVERVPYIPLIGVRVRLRLLDIEDALAQGTPLAGEELIRLEGPDLADNFEAICSFTGKDKKQHLLILSDDNFNKKYQQTLLMHFVLF